MVEIVEHCSNEKTAGLPLSKVATNQVIVNDCLVTQIRYMEHMSFIVVTSTGVCSFGENNSEVMAKIPLIES
jgi:hypothetical protein